MKLAQATLKACFLLFVSGLINPVIGQTVVSGSVTDSRTGSALVGAHVFVDNPENTGTFTDLSGRFELNIPQISESETRLFVTYLGYEPYQKKIATGREHQIDIKMSQTDGVVSETVVVRAPRMLSRDFALQTIEPLEIYQTPSSWGDPLLAMQVQPAVTTTDESANIALRGTSSRFSTVFFNHVPVRNAVRFSQVNGLGVFSIFDTEIIRDVTLFPGNPPLEYGNTNAGIVAIESNNRIADHTSGTINLNMGGFGGVVSNPLSGRFQVDFFGNLQNSYLLRETNPGSFEDLRESYSAEGGIHLIHHSRGGSLNRVYAYLLNENYGYDAHYLNSRGYQSYNSDRAMIIGNHTNPIGEWLLSVNTSFQYYRNNFQYRILDYYEESINTYGSADLSRDFGNRFSLKSGIAVEHNSYASSGTYNLLFYAFDEGAPTLQADTLMPLTYADAFLYGTYKLSESWSLGGGLRPGIRLDENDTYISGQIHVNHNLSRAALIRLSAGRYHQFDTPYLDRPTVRFSRSSQVSADFEYSPGRNRFAFSAFGNDITCIGCDLHYRTAGLEAFTQTGITRNLEWHASITAMRSLWLISGEWISTRFDARVMLNTGVNWQITPAFSLSSNVQWREGVPYTPVIGADEDEDGYFIPQYASINSRRHEDYFRWNMTVSHLFYIDRIGSLVAYATLNNITNHQNTRARTYNADFSETITSHLSRRFFLLGVSLQF